MIETRGQGQCPLVQTGKEGLTMVEGDPKII